MHIQLTSRDKKRMQEAALDLTMTIEEFILEAVQTALRETNVIVCQTQPIRLTSLRHDGEWQLHGVGSSGGALSPLNGIRKRELV